MMGELFQESPQYRDYLQDFASHFLGETETILTKRLQRTATITEAPLRALKKHVLSVPQREDGRLEVRAGGVVSVESDQPLTAEEAQALYQALQGLCPWRMGPYSIYGTAVRGQWHGDVKWQKLVAGGAFAGGLAGQKVADIGCHTGYFMFRLLAAARPDLIIGFEPVLRHYLTFHVFQNALRAPSLHFEPFGYEMLPAYPKFFDVILCLGVLYHHTDPVAILRCCHRALARGGRLILDCHGIPGEDAVALMPQKSYAGGSGYWWLPTEACLRVWIKRAGFARCETISPSHLIAPEEQKRSAQWADYPGLEEFLTGGGPSGAPALTCEGYPAPRRFYLRAIK